MERVFENMKEQDYFTLENQNGSVQDARDIDIEDYLEIMFADPEQFAVLTAPKAKNKVRYVQACIQGDQIEVQLGIEEEDGTHLMCKLCSREECMRIFLDFYDGFFAPEMKEYQPVQF